ncbi:MAG: hypothetical protein ACRD0K_00285 [Egibacteraceae bacterium]
MIDLASLAATVTELLAPWLPKLLGVAADQVVQQTGKSIADGTFEQAKRVWGALRSSEPARRKLEGRAEAIAAEPDSSDPKDIFRLLLKEALRENSDLADELGALLSDSPHARPTMKIRDVKGVGFINTGTIWGSAKGRGDAGR